MALARYYHYRRIDAIVPPVAILPKALEVIRRITRQNALDPRLEPTDRHMQRWAVSCAGGLPGLSLAWDIDTSSKFRLSPLPDAEAVITDRIVSAAPEHWRRFIRDWYRSEKPVDVIAQDHGMKRRALYEERRIVLAYLLGRLTSAGVKIPCYHWRA